MNRIKNISISFLVLVVGFSLLLSACGYRHPYANSGEEKNLYISYWQNKTNEPYLTTKLHQSLNQWFIGPNNIKLTTNIEASDLHLTGEILSISLPGLSYNAGNRASEIKIILKINYKVKNLKTGEYIIDNQNKIWTESYFTSESKEEGFDKIIDRISEQIYREVSRI